MAVRLTLEMESIAGMMEVMGFTNTEDTAEADVLIFNTCAVRRAAEEHNRW